MQKQNLVERLQFFVKRKLLERNFSSKAYWDLRYQLNWNSGQGSYGDSALSKAKVFNNIMKDFEIQSVIELGCGDGHQLQYYQIPQYLGLDVSRTTIKRIMELYEEDPTKSFMWYDPDVFQVKSQFIKADLAISVDVIFHLIEDAIFEKYLTDLFNSSEKFVAIYATNFNDEDQQVAHLKNRNFTDWIESNIKDWTLAETRPTRSETGEEFLDWFIYKKN